MRTYGFRGEALASLREVGTLEIITQCTVSASARASGGRDVVTMMKRMDHTGTLFLGPSIMTRDSHGTTVRVTGVFARWPVRRKALRTNVEIDAIIQRVQTFALINNGIAFSVIDSDTGARLLDTRPSQSVATIFGQLYGDARARSLAPFGRASSSPSSSSAASTAADTAAAAAAVSTMTVRGYIGLEGHHNRALQFFYVNGRCVTKTPVHKLLHRLFGKTSVCRPGKDADSDRIGREPVRHVVFVINLLCDPAE